MLDRSNDNEAFTFVGGPFVPFTFYQLYQLSDRSNMLELTTM